MPLRHFGAVSFDKGAFYLLGVGFGLATLSFVLIYELWFGKTLPRDLANVCTRLAYVSIAILLVLPPIAHMLTEDYVEQRGLSVCEEASTQWLFARTILYLDSRHECRKIQEESAREDFKSAPPAFTVSTPHRGNEPR